MLTFVIALGCPEKLSPFPQNDHPREKTRKREPEIPAL
jgi:hypothetical protein